MTINREKVKDTFASYTYGYDDTDPKIKLKIDHTYRVADISERIAMWKGLSQEDTDLAWLIGMLHDIGRFEQLRRFGTFSDAQSIDHAQFGVKLLFQENLIEEYLEECEERELLRRAIWNHNRYRVEENLEAREELFCHIIRDADKIDILRVHHDVPLEDIYDCTTRELYQSMVTPEVMEAFFEQRAVLRSLKKTPADHIVGHCSLVFELVFPVSYEIVQEQGYLEKILAFESKNEETKKQFCRLQKCMETYLQEMLKK